MSERTKNLRNIGIIVLLALLLWLVPQGAAAGRTVSNLLSLVFLAGLTFFGYRMYMENRMALFDLPDRLRMVLYGSCALLVITLIATGRMWNENGAFVLLWFAFIGIAVYGFSTVLRAYREH